MPQYSASEKDWNDRAELLNYRCRSCRVLITFPDQELYFKKGLCGTCFQAEDENNPTGGRPLEKLRQWRERG